MSGKVRRSREGVALLVATASSLSACGDSSTEPGLDVSLVAGTYSMTVLRFDPQGILPESDVLPALGEPPQLNLTSAGQAQIVYRDPVSTLVATVQGTYRTTATGVGITFTTPAEFRQLLLSQRMDFTYSEQVRTLAFEAAAPDGVSRTRLIELVPSLAGEQLLDPTPGFLRVVFTRN